MGVLQSFEAHLWIPEGLEMPHICTLELQIIFVSLTNKSKSLKLIHARPRTPYAASSLLITLLLPTDHLSQPLPPPNPALHTNQITFDDFHETPVRHMSSQKPPPQPPNPVPAAPKTSVYDHDNPMGMVKYLRAVEIAEGRPDPLPPPPPPPPPPSAPPPLMTDKRKPKYFPPLPPPPCARVGCGELRSLDKRSSKCLVACYCSDECQREDWPARIRSSAS